MHPLVFVENLDVIRKGLIGEEATAFEELISQTPACQDVKRAENKLIDMTPNSVTFETLILLKRAEEARSKSTRIKGDLSGDIKRAIKFARNAIRALAVRASVINSLEYKKRRFLEDQNEELKDKLRKVTKRVTESSGKKKTLPRDGFHEDEESQWKVVPWR